MTGHFEKAPGSSQVQVNIIPGEQRAYVCALSLALTIPLIFLPTLCPSTPLLPGDAFTSHCVPSHPGVHNHVALAAMWPVAVWAPATGSGRKPEVDSIWEQAKLPGWGFRPFSSCLQVPKDCTLRWRGTLTSVAHLVDHNPKSERSLGQFPRRAYA